MKKTKYNIKNFIIFIVGIIVLTIIDQATKIIAVDTLKNKKAFVVIKDAFEFYYLENKGAAWGMLDGAMIFFIVLTIIIVFVLSFAMIKMPIEKKYIPLKIMSVFMAAGAIGNFIDRITLGYVRDFIYFKLINFPVFNFADIYVTLSVFLFAILILFVYKESDFDFIKLKKDNNK